MRSEFSLVTHNGLDLLVYLPWWRAGVIHGMTTAKLGCTSATLESDIAAVKMALSVEHVALPHQNHGSRVVDMRSSEAVRVAIARHGDIIRREPGDAIAAPLIQGSSEGIVLYGVLTADCVPILVRGDHGYVAIHAGWRGLAGGVIATSLPYVGTPCEALIFACAGPQLYEVGSDVIEAIGVSAVFQELPHRQGKYLLNTVATAVRQLQGAYSGVIVHAAEVCTISDPRFHSFRRDAERSGRCVTFVVPGAG